MILNSIYNEDCLKTMAKMPNNFIDLTITSPPYDNARNYCGYEFNFHTIAKELFRVTKDGGVTVWVVGDQTIKGNETGTPFKQALYFKEIGFNLHDTMIYSKGGMGACGSIHGYWQDFEYMFVFTKGKLGVFNPICDRKNKEEPNSRIRSNGHRNKDGSRKGRRINHRKEYGRRFNIWQYHEGGTRVDHPAVFPEKLVHDHVISWSNENALIYDPMAGSGTTGIVAKRLNRNFILSEISNKYCQLIQHRFQKIFGDSNAITNAT